MKPFCLVAVLLGLGASVAFALLLPAVQKVREAANRIKCANHLNACLLLAGCSRGPRIAPVRGRVTYNGKPVTTGKIWFYPENGRPALGVLAEDGTYTLTTDRPGDGALVGTHRVAIQSTTVGPGSMAGPKSREEEVALSQQGHPGTWLVAGKVAWLVPEKYSRPETSGLTAKVEDTHNELNFDIPVGK